MNLCFFFFFSLQPKVKEDDKKTTKSTVTKPGTNDSSTQTEDIEVQVQQSQVGIFRVELS